VTKKKFPAISGWNHRVVKRTVSLPGGGTEAVFAIHEVYYGTGAKRNVGHSWTENPVHPQGETLDELKRELTMMYQATLKPTLEEVRGTGQMKDRLVPVKSGRRVRSSRRFSNLRELMKT